MLETKLRALESLGCTKGKFADFLEPLVESCLPESVLGAWERSRISGDADDSRSQRSLEKLMSFCVMRGSTNIEKFKSNIELSDVTCNENDIDLLIGAYLIGKLLTGRCVQLNFVLAAIYTKLGWTVIGKETGLYSIDDYPVTDSVQTVLFLYVDNASLRELQDIESLGNREPIKNVSKRKAFHEKLTVLPDCWYEVELPWKLDARANLPNNKELALQRRENAILKARNKGMISLCFVFCMLILCFINNCNKNSVSKSSKVILSEIEGAETVLIRLIQGECFSIANAVPSVDVFKDENGILRVKTRITERKGVLNFLNPILLPNNFTLTKRF
ncbi:hypothetical protein AVEN_114915-1 [Araneus ventricosus]|uniref:Uncharacterized protein n=1 Tax=Araneus ventricosus TaxID=182803 RepID=A0A4Y2RNM2_ARAVE|nr:hypothetical protein AVEN_114915-1 [Araneus ventricosus]